MFKKHDLKKKKDSCIKRTTALVSMVSCHLTYLEILILSMIGLQLELCTAKPIEP